MKHFFKKALCFIALCTATSFSVNSQYRIALSFDGNSWDEDDIIAAPLSLAIIEESGNKDKLVHVEFNNNRVRNDGNQPEDMRISINGSISRWGFDKTVFFEAFTNAELQETRTHFMNIAAAAYDDGESLYYICAGPMQVPIECIKKIDQNSSWTDSRKNAIKANIIVVSHSNWNERFGNSNAYDANLPTWEDLITTGVKNVKLADQNSYDGDNDMNTPINKWSFLKNLASGTTDKYEWLFNRNPFNNKFDPSDAGMVYWLVNGHKGYSGSGNINIREANLSTNRERYASPAKIEDLFNNTVSIPTVQGPFYLQSPDSGRRLFGGNSKLQHKPTGSAGDYIQWYKIDAGNERYYLQLKGNSKYLQNNGNQLNLVTEVDLATKFFTIGTDNQGFGHIRVNGTDQNVRRNHSDGQNDNISCSTVPLTGKLTKWSFIAVDSKIAAHGNIPTVKLANNPVSDIVLLQNYNDHQDVTIYNSNGTIVKQHRGENTIDISSLSSGIYILKTN